jgi:hypothetical protein
MISSGQLLRLPTSPCSLLPAPMPLFPSSDRYHHGIFPRDHLMLLGGLHHFFSWLHKLLKLHGCLGLGRGRRWSAMDALYYGPYAPRHNITNKYFPNVEKFKYMGMAVINKNCIFHEVMSRISSQNICYYLFPYIL